MSRVLHGPYLEAGHVFHRVDRLLGHDMARAGGKDRQEMKAFLIERLLNFREHGRIAERAIHLSGIVEQERQGEDGQVGNKIRQGRVRRHGDVDGAHLGPLDAFHLVAEGRVVIDLDCDLAAGFFFKNLRHLAHADAVGLFGVGVVAGLQRNFLRRRGNRHRTHTKGEAKG